MLPLPRALAAAFWLALAATVCAADPQQSPTQTPFRWGPLRWHPKLEYTLSHSDGVQAAPGTPTSTDSQEYSSAFEMDLGKKWLLTYVPTWKLYSNGQFKDSLDHVFNLMGTPSHGAWGGTVQQSYTSSSMYVLETGAQMRQQIYVTSLGLGHVFSPDVQAQGSVVQNVRLAEASPATRDWKASGTLNYAFMPQLTGGLGVTGGYTATVKSSDAILASPNAQLNWNPTQRTSFTVSGGLQNRWFLGRNGGQVSSPVFSSTASFTPWQTTKLDFSASRQLEQSYFTNVFTTRTGWTASLNQRLLGKIFTSFAFARGTSNFKQTLFDVRQVRKDVNDSLSVGLTANFLRRGSATVSYTEVRNHSTAPGLSLHSTTFSLALGYGY
jgi:hypothetical protein